VEDEVVVGLDNVLFVGAVGVVVLVLVLVLFVVVDLDGFKEDKNEVKEFIFDTILCYIFKQRIERSSITTSYFFHNGDNCTHPF